jgi:hypothetical protein
MLWKNNERNSQTQLALWIADLRLRVADFSFVNPNRHSAIPRLVADDHASLAKRRGAISLSTNEKGPAGKSQSPVRSFGFVESYPLTIFTEESSFISNSFAEIFRLRSRPLKRIVVASSFFSTILVCTGMPEESTQISAYL